jgi:hypothetical protein
VDLSRFTREDVVRARIVVALAAALVGMPAVGESQEAEALRRDLEQMRQRLEIMTREYQAVIKTLSERLQRLEAAPRPEAAPPAVVQPHPEETPRVPGLVDLARPREPFSLYDRRGAGHFLFDLGVVGDFVGSITQRAVERADAGTFTGRENRFFPREVELVLFGQIDPYARGEVRLEAAEEFEDGERASRGPRRGEPHAAGAAVGDASQAGSHA